MPRYNISHLRIWAWPLRKKHNFEDALFVLDTPMLEDQDMSEDNKFEETDPSTSMSCILQRVKRIHEMLKKFFSRKAELR